METLLIIYLISIVFGGLFCYTVLSEQQEIRVKDLFMYLLAFFPPINTAVGAIWIVIKLDEIYDIDDKLNKVVWRKK